MDGQISMFGPDLVCGKMCPARSPADGTQQQEQKDRERTSGSSLSRFSKLKNHTFMLLDLRPDAGNMLGPYWDYDPAWLGSLGTLNTRSAPATSPYLSCGRFLQVTVPS